MEESKQRRRDQDAQKLAIEQETLRQKTAVAAAKHRRKQGAEDEKRKKELARVKPMQEQADELAREAETGKQKANQRAMVKAKKGANTQQKSGVKRKGTAKVQGDNYRGKWLRG